MKGNLLLCLALVGAGGLAGVAARCRPDRGATEVRLTRVAPLEQPVSSAQPRSDGPRTSAEFGALERFPMLETATHQDVRLVLDFCAEAGRRDLAGLRHAALRSPDPLVAGNALRALGRLGAVLDDAQLLALLDDPRLRVRQELVMALGRSNEQRAVGFLAPILEQDDPRLRRLAIHALGQLGGGPARASLESFAPRATAEERPFLHHALKG